MSGEKGEDLDGETTTRRHPRADARLTVELDDGTGPALRAPCLDLSPTGMRVRVPQALPDGRALRVRWSSGGRTLDLAATVVWSEGGEVGLAFADADPATVERSITEMRWARF